MMKKSPVSSLLFMLLISLLMSAPSWAELKSIEEQDLGEVTGEGLAILPQNIRIVFDPLAYIRMMPRGAPVNSACQGTGCAGGVSASPDRAADLAWYGAAFTGADYSVAGMNSRASNNVIANWGKEDNPWVFRSFNDNNLTFAGAAPGIPVLQYAAPVFRTGTSNSTGDFVDPTVMALKYAFYGDFAVCNSGTPTYGSTAACGGLGVASKLTSLSVWDGFSFHGSKYNIFQTMVDYTGYLSASTGSVYGTEFKAVAGSGVTGTFGAVWLNRINSSTSGVLRFGVNGPTSSTTFPPVTEPVFNAYEGVWITDLDINMIIGHMHYQPMIFDSDSNGNLIIEVVRIPNLNTVYNYAYQNYGSSVDPTNATCTSGGNCPQQNIAAKMCTNSTLDCADPAASQQATHGQVTMGKVEFRDTSNNSTLVCNSAGTSPCGASSAASMALNGIFIQHLKIKTLGL